MMFLSCFAKLVTQFVVAFNEQALWICGVRKNRDPIGLQMPTPTNLNVANSILAKERQNMRFNVATSIVIFVSELGSDYN
jgi:hypothetical protein